MVYILSSHDNDILTEQEKFAAVDNDVPTTLPLSPIPSKKILIISEFVPIIHKKQSPRVISDTYGQIILLLFELIVSIHFV